MIDELRHSTLALQHFYDIERVGRRTPLGTIFDATELPFERPVSVWVLDRLRDMGADDALLDRFESLAYTASRLTCASTARTLDVGRVEPTVPFVVMERLEGRDLRQHLAVHGPLDVAATLRVVDQVATAIVDAHAAGIFGLGLDATRVIVTDAQRMTVRTWGHGLALSRRELLALDDAIVELDLLRHVPPADFVDDATRGADTPDPDAIANPPADVEDFADAPHDTFVELDDHDDDHDDDDPLELDDDPLALAVDPAAAGAADLYALAAIAYECLGGVHPYFREDRDVGDGVLAILRESPAALDDHFDVAPQLAAVVRSALGRDTRATFATVTDFAAGLRAAADPEDRTRADDLARPSWFDPGLSLQTSADTSRKRARQARHTTVRALQVAVALLVAGYVVLALFGLRGEVDDAVDVPEFVAPAPAGEGTDLVIDVEVPTDLSDPNAPAASTEADLYLVSNRGETVLLGQTPYLLRSQAVDTRLRFVVSGDTIEPHQMDVVVREMPDRTQIVRERIAPRLDPVTAARMARRELDAH